MEERFEQQDRLRNIITKLGGSPTTARAVLPKLTSIDVDALSNTVKAAAKPMVSSDSKDAIDVEKELMQTKQDAIIESAEVISHKMLILMAQEIGITDIIPDLNDSLQEETSMVNFITGNTPLVLRLLLSEFKISDASKKKVAQTAAR